MYHQADLCYSRLYCLRGRFVGVVVQSKVIFLLILFDFVGVCPCGPDGGPRRQTRRVESCRHPSSYHPGFSPRFRGMTRTPSYVPRTPWSPLLRLSQHQLLDSDLRSPSAPRSSCTTHRLYDHPRDTQKVPHYLCSGL